MDSYRRYCIIVLLLVSAIASGQLQIIGPISSSINIDLDWEDTVTFTNLYFEDWQDFPITSTSAATFPVGIDDDTVAAYLLNFESVSSDDTELGHGDPDSASNLDIILFQSVKVVRSWYLINRCCTGAVAQEGAGTIDGGTGGDLRAWIEDPKTWTPRAIVHFWIYYPRSTDQYGLFENSDGFKNMAIAVDKDGVGDDASAGLMVIDYGAGTELDPAYYTWAYWDGWLEGDKRIENNTKTQTPASWFPPGWHMVSFVVDAGNGEGTDGWMHLYVDGKLIDDGAGGGIRNSIPFRNSTTPDGFSYIEFRWFMGGNSDSYDSPKTQWLHFGPIGIEVQPGYDTTPAADQPIYIPKYMKELGLEWD